ncbi:hypothetical protein HDV04_003050 [Boothiomyces sp. JEL0838]|nr:hypothetical protein HDV04_003050 [Boothiomyces sp. JEL0838]
MGRFKDACSQLNPKNLSGVFSCAFVYDQRLSSKNNLIALQGKGLKISAALELLGEKEDSFQLGKIAKLIKEKEMHRLHMIQRIQGLSIEPLQAYPLLCDKLLHDIKNQKQAVNSQRKKKEVAENIMLKEAAEIGNLKSRRISKSQLDLAEAVGQVSMSTECLQEGYLKFEEQKADDFRNSVKELVWSEMQYHAKSLEYLTEMFAFAQEIENE